MDASKLLDSFFPHIDECRRRATTLGAAHPGKTSKELAELAIKHARRWAAVTGVISGISGNPLAMLPAAAADAFIVMKSKARLAGVVAALIAPDGLNDEETFRTDILALMFPAAVSQALRVIGVQVGQHTSKVLIRRYISNTLLREAARLTVGQLGFRLTQRAFITKAMPLVGGLIGGTWNWLEVRRMGNQSVAYHQGEELPITDEDAPSSTP